MESLQKTSLEKYEALKNQREAFSSKLISEMSRLEALKEQYLQIMSSVQEETGATDTKSLMEYLNELDRSLSSTSDSLKTILDAYHEED